MWRSGLPTLTRRPGRAPANGAPVTAAPANGAVPVSPLAGVTGPDGDLPEKAHLEERLRETAERYLWLFEDSALAMYVCDAEGKVLEANAALCRLLQCAPGHVVGQAMGSFSIDPPFLVTELEPFLSGASRTFSCLRRYRATDGRVLRARVTLAAARDPDGRARTIFGEIEDLTPQYLAGKEIDRERRRLQVAIEASDIAVWELDIVSGIIAVQDRVPGATGRVYRASRTAVS